MLEPTRLRRGTASSADGRAARAPASQRRCSGDRGSGSAIGAVIVFPFLMLFIVALHSITFATRTEQAVRTAADRAARTAALCCLHVDEARDAALLIAVGPNTGLPIENCANHMFNSTVLVFEDADGNVVPAVDRSGNPSLVPAGGQVTAHIGCQLPAGRLGAFALAAWNVWRWASSTASIDPFRHRAYTP